MPRPFSSTFRLFTAAALFTAPTAASGQIRGAERVLSGLDARAAEYGKVAQQIWDFAEMGYQEAQSSALLQARLAAAGFQVQVGVAGEPTAFVATWGSGKPVIGIMGEFDALPGLSQARVPVARPLLAGGPGHGCGHHLFGTAAAAAAISIREWLEANGGKG
ncbi:MAG: amidohydrolase, partial [Gemmatimonadota bacterium]